MASDTVGLTVGEQDVHDSEPPNPSDHKIVFGGKRVSSQDSNLEVSREQLNKPSSVPAGATRPKYDNN